MIELNQINQILEREEHRLAPFIGHINTFVTLEEQAGIRSLKKKLMEELVDGKTQHQGDSPASITHNVPEKQSTPGQSPVIYLT